MTSHTYGQTFQTLGLFLGTLLCALAAAAETPPDPDAPETAPAAGLRVYLDPVTGELTDRPTAEQVEKLSSALDEALLRTADDLEPFDLESGGQGLFLAGRFRSAAIARRLPDGTFDLRCVETAGHADHLLEAPPEAVEPVWEEK